MQKLRIWLAIAVFTVLAMARPGGPSALATGGVSTNDAAALREFVTAKFGKLSEAERRLTEGAPSRELAWAGHSTDPDDPSNDSVHGDKWGSERTIRATLLSWLSSDLEAARYVHPSGLGIAGARIEGRLDLSYLKVPRSLTLVHCYLPAGIDLSHAEAEALYLRKSMSGPVTADLAKISGDVAMVYGSYQTASFFRARIGGDLDCTGSHFAGGGHAGVSAVEAVILGDATFHDGFTTDGMVDFRLAKLGGSLSFNNVGFTGAENGLNAERATIDGTLYWVDVHHTSSTQLDLENARAGALWDDRASWPAQGNLSVEGFVYGAISGGPADARSRLDWLSSESPGYHPQPFRQLATVLRDSGEDAGSTDVLIAKEISKRQYAGLSRAERTWNLLLEMTIGYGYRPLRALWWIIGFVALGTLLFGAGYYVRIVAPTEESAYHSFVASGSVPLHYPPFNAFVYSLENFLPVVELHQGAYWRPNPRHGLGGGPQPAGQSHSETIPGSLLRWYLWLHILAGWTLTPLLFAGLSGLIRAD